MDLPPFLLDQFMATYEFASPPIRYNLAASAGPVWTFGELMALGGDAKRELDELRISCIPAQGTQRLRERIADFHYVDPDWVVVTMGTSRRHLRSHGVGCARQPEPSRAVYARSSKLDRLGATSRRTGGFSVVAGRP